MPRQSQQTGAMRADSKCEREDEDPYEFASVRARKQALRAQARMRRQAQVIVRAAEIRAVTSAFSSGRTHITIPLRRSSSAAPYSLNTRRIADMPTHDTSLSRPTHVFIPRSSRVPNRQQTNAPERCTISPIFAPDARTAMFIFAPASRAIDGFHFMPPSSPRDADESDGALRNLALTMEIKMRAKRASKDDGAERYAYTSRRECAPRSEQQTPRTPSA